MVEPWPWLAAASAGLAVWWGVPPPGLARLRAGTRGPWLSPRGLVVTAWWRSTMTGRQDRRREAALRASVPGVCDLLAVCLDAGRPPRAALRVVCGVLDGPAAVELAGVLQRIDLGVDEAEAWGFLAAVPGYRQVARDLARSVRSGAGLAALLRQHAVDARREATTRALVRARGAGVRSVAPLMVCFLPAFVLLGIVPLFGSLAGQWLP